MLVFVLSLVLPFVLVLVLPEDDVGEHAIAGKNRALNSNEAPDIERKEQSQVRETVNDICNSFHELRTSSDPQPNGRTQSRCS